MSSQIEEYYEEEIIEEEEIISPGPVAPAGDYIRRGDPPMVKHNRSSAEPLGQVVGGVDNTDFVTYPPPRPPSLSSSSSNSSGSSTSNDEESQQQEAAPRGAPLEMNYVGDDDEKIDPGFGPKQRWKHKLCDCCDVIICTPLCCMTCFCNMVVVAQIMSRLGLDWCGNPNPAGAANTFAVIVLLYCAYWAGCVALIGLVFTPVFLCYMLVIYTRTRYETRQYFDITPEYCECCSGMMEDCCVQVFCSCCSTIQIARHTHDEARYPYQFDSKTGLPDYAPPMY